MSKIYINMTISGYVSAAALAAFTANLTLMEDGSVSGASSLGANVHGLGPDTAVTKDTEEVAAGETVVTSNEQAGKRDAAGTLFDPARHTGSIVKSGLWRLKTGVARGPGEDLPTEAKADTTSQASAAVGATDEDDEFAAFASAAAEPAAVKGRTWTDADLSKLTNQAAKALGSPEKVKETIVKFVPASETPHSRNIPADKREDFAQAVEAIAGIEYAG